MTRTLGILGVVGVMSATALLVRPIQENGVSGTALRPRYSEAVWFAYAPWADTRSQEQIRSDAVRAPRNAVRTTRLRAGAVLVLGAGALLGAVVTRPRSR